jgi:hypothetical protein
MTTKNIIGIRTAAGSFLLSDIVDKLVHGSGVDCDWRVNVRGNVVEFCNSYHAMNDNGMYCGWHDFKVVLSRAAASAWHELKGPLSGHVQITTIKGDIGWRIVGLSGRMDDAGDWLSDCLHDDFKPFGVWSRGLTRGGELSGGCRLDVVRDVVRKLENETKEKYGWIYE